MKKQYKIKPTEKQKRAVENILSGRFNSKKAALLDAHYSKKSSENAKLMLEKKGVKQYLAALGNNAKKRWNMEIEDKLLNVYMDGLDAEKPYGKDAQLHADHPTRLKFADRLSEFFGWRDQEGKAPVSSPKMNQFNFFSTPKEEREAFDEKLIKFLRSQ